MSRTLTERKVSLQFRIAELRESLRAAECADAELDREIEEAERGREAARAPDTRRLVGAEQCSAR